MDLDKLITQVKEIRLDIEKVKKEFNDLDTKYKKTVRQGRIISFSLLIFYIILIISFTINILCRG